MILVTATLGGITQYINGNGQRLVSGSIAQDVEAVSGFTFEIDPTNAGYDLIQSRKTIIKCQNDRTGRVEFYGRVLLSEQKMNSSGVISKTVTCEGLLGYLHDSVQPYRAEALYTLSDFIDMVLTNHNDQVDEDKWMFRGEVNVDAQDQIESEIAQTGLIYKGLQWQTTFETLKTKLLDVYGGELEVVEVDGILYLNYLKQTGVTRATPIELGSNMQDASREVSPLDIVTRIIPLGAKLKVEVEDEEGNISTEESEERLTLVGHTLDDGTVMTVPWIDDEEKIATLGVIVGTLDCSNITEQYNLYARAREWMIKENRVSLSHTLTAIDLRELGYELDGINCGDSYPVRNRHLGLDEVLRVIKKTFDINAPYKGSLTIGEKKATLSSLQATESERVDVQLQELVTKSEQLAGQVASQNATFSAGIYKTAQEVVTEATANLVTIEGMNKTIEEAKASLSVDAEDIEMRFNSKLTEMETGTDEKLSSLFTELHAYIRYYKNSAGQPVIELGEKDSDIICYLTNSRLDFKMNGMPIAYIANDENGVSQLFITNATILQRLNLGAFTFKMRENNNLSMIKTREV